MGLAAGGHLGDGLDAATAGLGDLAERALQRGPGDALTAVPLVDVEAGDPPVRQRRRVLVVLAPVLDVRELGGAAVLAPPLRGAVVIEDKSRVGAAVADPGLLCRAIVGPLLAGQQVIADAPASAEDAVVAFDKLGERIPGGCVQGAGCVWHHRQSPIAVCGALEGGNAGAAAGYARAGSGWATACNSATGLGSGSAKVSRSAT